MERPHDRPIMRFLRPTGKSASDRLSQVYTTQTLGDLMRYLGKTKCDPACDWCNKRVYKDESVRWREDEHTEFVVCSEECKTQMCAYLKIPRRIALKRPSGDAERVPNPILDSGGNRALNKKLRLSHYHVCKPKSVTTRYTQPRYIMRNRNTEVME